ncbi:MAG: hypothetical protein WCW03_00355 [Candidatus Paceibacterota bacterium]|jgi:hypothetical protein
MKISFQKIIFTLVFLLLPFIVSAGTEHNIFGYAWSSNVGWISFNGVNKDASGNLIGYAWSSNVGWIQFGGLSGFPSGTGTQAQNAKISGNNLKGWAKALSADGNGWDGWISLSGAGYGVTLSGTSLTGYGWGSTVIGWVDFNLVTIVPSIPTEITGACSLNNIPYSDLNPVTIFSLGDIVTFKLSNIGGGTNPTGYTYELTVGSGWTPISLNANSSYIHTFIITTGVGFPTVIKVTNAGITKDIQCGKITVLDPTPPATVPPGPLLWFKDRGQPNSNVKAVWDQQAKTVREGTDVEVVYDRDSLLCYGYSIPSVIPGDSNWGNQGFITQNSNYYINPDHQIYKFTNLVKGKYVLILTCDDSLAIKIQYSWLANIINSFSQIFAQSPSTIDSNRITINVVKPTIEEI